MATQNDDVTHWLTRVKDALNNPATITGPKPAGAKPWHHRFVSFFAPIDLCAITCCCPCITFGKTHHRLHHSSSLDGYEPINTTCLGFCLTSCFCGNVVMTVLQRNELQRRFGLNQEAGFLGDVARAVCCGCCDVVQQEKEAEYQLLNNQSLVYTQQPTVGGHEMKVPEQSANPA